MCSLPKGRIQTIRPTNDEGNIAALKLPSLKLARQRHGGQASTAFVQRNNACAFGNGGFDAHALGGIELL